MANITIVPNMDKQGEKDLIKKFFAALPEDSYLKPILAGLPAYCEVQIDNDWAISPLDTIEHNRAEHEATLKALKANEEGYLKTVNRLEARVAALDNACKDYIRESELADKMIEQKTQAIDQAYEARVIAEGKVAGLEHMVERQALELQALKAKLYDYMTKEN